MQQMNIMEMSTMKLIERCFNLGQEKPNLSEDQISKHLAKIIVSEKILDDDAFEIGRQAYDKGQTEVT
jgi:hypothetical protein